MMITSKSMAPIARRKKPKDGSGITALPLLLAFAISLERRAGGLVPKQLRPTRQKARNAPPVAPWNTGNAANKGGIVRHGVAAILTFLPPVAPRLASRLHRCAKSPTAYQNLALAACRGCLSRYL